jgi:hypothetical protein
MLVQVRMKQDAIHVPPRGTLWIGPTTCLIIGDPAGVARPSFCIDAYRMSSARDALRGEIDVC